MSYTSKTNLKTDVSNLLTIVITKADHTSANDLIIDGLALETDLLKLKYGLTYVWTSSQTEDPNVGITPPISPSDQEKGLTLEGANAGDIWEYDSGAGNWVKLYNANDAPIADIQNKVDKILGISGSVYNDSIPVISVQDETGAEISGTGDANIKTSGYKIADFILKKDPITFTTGNLTRFTAAGDIEDAGASVTDFAYSRFLGLGAGSTGDVAVTGALLDLAIEDAPLSGNIGIKQVYEVTGSGSVDYVDNANLSSGLWERGRIVKLNFQSTVTFNHDTAIANPGDEVPFLLLSSSNTIYNSGDSRYFECIDDSGDLKLKELTLEVLSAGGYGLFETTVGDSSIAGEDGEYLSVYDALNAGKQLIKLVGSTLETTAWLNISGLVYIQSIDPNYEITFDTDIYLQSDSVVSCSLVLKDLKLSGNASNGFIRDTTSGTTLNTFFTNLIITNNGTGTGRNIAERLKGHNIWKKVKCILPNQQRSGIGDGVGSTGEIYGDFEDIEIVSGGLSCYPLIDVWDNTEQLNIKNLKLTGTYSSTQNIITGKYLNVKGGNLSSDTYIRINYGSIENIKCDGNITIVNNYGNYNNNDIVTNKNIVITGNYNNISNNRIGTTNGGTATITINGDDNQVEGNFVEAAVVNTGVNNNIQYKLF